jgi:hypothetical protein
MEAVVCRRRRCKTASRLAVSPASCSSFSTVKK